MTARLVAAVAAAAALTLAACGDNPTAAEQAVRDTESHLDDIKSGRMRLELLASADDAEAGRGVGFVVAGRFDVDGKKGELPIAELDYTRVTGAARRTTRFVSTGRDAFIRIDGSWQRLTDKQVSGMRLRGGDGGGLEGLSLDKWIDEPATSPGPTTDGVATTRIKGAVDAVDAINDIVALARGLGADDGDIPEKLEGDAADRVRRAARGSRVELLSGRTDRLLRKLDLNIQLSIGDVDARVRRALRGLTGTTLNLSIDLTDVNEPVRVESPV